MSYTSVVDELRQRELEIRAQAFADHYRPDLPSLVLLPGGMGSRLLRSTVPFQPSQSQPFNNALFYELWLDLARAIVGDLRELAMTKYGEDIGGQPIIASGELSSLAKTYTGVETFFAGKANYVGLGYDWRRAPDKEYMYVRSFLRRIADKVIAKGLPDPRPQLTLFAHSQGGLVGKLFVNDLVERHEKAGDWFARLVTCCTPFYGTLSQLSRFYLGEDLINVVTGGPAAVARIVASLKGPYVLMPAPKAVLGPRLAALGLARYPVRDLGASATECDPFDPAMRARLPGYLVDDYLGGALTQYPQIDAQLPPEAANLVFHVRSDVTGGTRDFEMYWNAAPGAADPITHNGAQGGRHDGTVPFWSARLADTPAARVFDVSGVPHGGAAENPTVLGIVWNLMNRVPVAPGPQPTAPGPDFGPLGPVRALLVDVQAGARPVSDLTGLPAEDFRTLMRGLTFA